MSILKDLKTPIFYVEGIPNIDISSYKLIINGLVKKERVFNFEEIKRLPFSRVDARLTSVSGWSVRAVWEGVLFKDIVEEIEPTEDGKYVTFHSVNGYTTIVSFDDIMHPRSLICYAVNGEELEPEYGGPVRAIIPHLWGYKSCKGLVRVEFTDSMDGGYWEDRGYSRSGKIEEGITLDINTRNRRWIKGGEVLDF